MADQIEGSRTQTVTETQPPHLVLRGAEDERPRLRRHVAWAEGTIDNEFMNKKKSKICCIFTPNSGDYEEESDSDSSSSSSSSDSSDSSDSESDGEPQHNHGDGHDHCNHHHHGKKAKKSKGKEELPKPNAYEIQPKYRKIGEEGLLLK